jgi:ribosome-associated heat shock protein Hsp15
VWTVTVLLVSETRGPAVPLAQTMYEETEASRTARATEAEKRRYFHEPAAAIHGRPTKRDRRRLDSGWG